VTDVEVLLEVVAKREVQKRPGAYDLWIADEAWDVDYYLHENPELAEPDGATPV
jgi:hypothetical protein